MIFSYFFLQNIAIIAENVRQYNVEVSYLPANKRFALVKRNGPVLKIALRNYMKLAFFSLYLNINLVQVLLLLYTENVHTPSHVHL